MPALERRISLRGPRFYIDADTVMFVNQIDGSTRDGPREATEADREAHPEAWATLGQEVEHGAPAPLQRIAVRTPEGAKPAAEPKPHAQRRQAALERGEAA